MSEPEQPASSPVSPVVDTAALVEFEPPPGFVQKLAERVQHEGHGEDAAEVERLTAEVERLNDVRLNARDQWRADLDEIADALGLKADLPTSRIVNWAALTQEIMAKTRKALQVDAAWTLQHGALAVRQERDRLREHLATAVVLPQDAGDRVWSAAMDDDRWTSMRADEIQALIRLTLDQVRSWGVSSSEAEAPQEMVQHEVGIRHTGGGWRADCKTCGEWILSSKSEARVEDWRDQHEADTLRPAADFGWVRVDLVSQWKKGDKALWRLDADADGQECTVVAVAGTTALVEADEFPFGNPERWSADFSELHPLPAPEPSCEELVPNGPEDAMVCGQEVAPGSERCEDHGGRPSGSGAAEPQPVREYRCDQPAHSAIPCERCEPIVDGGAKFLGDRWKRSKDRSKPRCTGISSDALALLGVGALNEVPWDSYPQDDGDLAACERTFDMAPPYIQDRMAEQLLKFRAHVRSKWSTREPEQDAAQAARSEATQEDPLPVAATEAEPSKLQTPRVFEFGVDVEPHDVDFILDQSGDRWERGTDAKWHCYDDSLGKPLYWQRLLADFGPLTELARGVSGEAVTSPQPRVWRQGDPEPPRYVVLEDDHGDRLTFLERGWAWVRVSGSDTRRWVRYGLPWNEIDWYSVAGGQLSEVSSSPRKEGEDAFADNDATEFTRSLGEVDRG